MDSLTKNHNELNPAVIAFISAAFITALNLFLNTGIMAIISYSIASGLYFLYALFSSADSRMNTDYIESGDASIAVLFLFITGKFISDNIIISIAFTVIFIFIIYFFIEYFNSQSYSGIFLNPVSILIFAYLLFSEKNSSILIIKKILSGSAGSSPEAIIIFSAISILSFIFIIRYKSTGILYSHGKIYSGNFFRAGIYLHYLFLLLKSFLLVSLIYLSGIAGFAAFYIYRLLHKGKISISLIFYFIFFHLAVLLSLRYADPLAVSAAVIFLSLISNIIYKLNKVDIYGRSIRYKL